MKSQDYFWIWVYGKTVITLTAVNDLKYNRFQIRKALVIAPKKVAEDTWTREQEKWEHLKNLRIIPVLGSLRKRIIALNTPGDVYVINRENTEWLVDYYKNDWPFDLVVIDELSSFKNPSSKRFKALKRVRPLIHRIIGLTRNSSTKWLYRPLDANLFVRSRRTLRKVYNALQRKIF